MRLLTLALVGASIAPWSVHACIGWSTQSVRFGDQTTLVAWSPETKIQHFVRIAHFDSSQDFAFVAPTPVTPELSEADPNVFNVLQRVKPVRTKSASIIPGISVLQSVDVGSFHAVTIRASDRAAIDAYLAENGYSLPDGTTEWLKPYVERGWVLTAFKLRTKLADSRIIQEAIRMTFKTDAPFNPYSVPKGNLGQGGRLKMFTMSPGNLRVKAQSGLNTQPAWTHPVNSDRLERIAELIKLPPGSLDGHTTVAMYEMPFAHAEFDDLEFETHGEGTPMPVLAGIVGLGLAGIVWRIVRDRP